MSARKSRREVDKAINHLMAYTGPNEEWAGRLEVLENDFLFPVAEKLDLSPEEAVDFFFAGPFEHMTFGFLFEEYASVQWDNDEHSLIGAYLQHRGWREGPAGRRYLQALDQSELKFWEITVVKPGSYADIRPYGTHEKPIRVKEKAATQSLHQWDGLAARVLRMDGANIFSGAMLPFNPEAAGRIQSVLAAIPDSTRDWMQELVDDGQMEALPDDMDAIIRDTQDAELPALVFLVWAVDTYLQTMGASPELRNMDDEPIEPTQLRFPLRGERSMVAKVLDTSPLLNKGDDGNHWVWLPKPAQDTPENERISIQGHIELTDARLQLDTNSAARAERGGALLSSLLGNLVGTPLTVHENLERIGEYDEPVDFPSEVPPELQEAMEAHLTSHYRQTLDEPIPMLNGKTPRECATDPALKSDVIGWLKHLENSGMRSAQAPYDFAWIWDELNLERD